jgi:hypothetical protein
MPSWCIKKGGGGQHPLGESGGEGEGPQGADSPLPLRVAKTGKHYLNEEINPLLPTGIGERYSQTISSLGHATLLRRCELPLQT